MFCWQNNNLPFLVLLFLWTPNVLRVLVYCSLLEEEVGTLLLFTFGLVVVVLVECREHGGLLCWPLLLLLINGGHFTKGWWLWWGMKVLWLVVLISRLISGDWNHWRWTSTNGLFVQSDAQWAERFLKMLFWILVFFSI